MEKVKNQTITILIILAIATAALILMQDAFGVKSYNQARATAVVMEAETYEKVSIMEQNRLNRQQVIDAAHQPVEDVMVIMSMAQKSFFAILCFVPVMTILGIYFWVMNDDEEE